MRALTLEGGIPLEAPDGLELEEADLAHAAAMAREVSAGRVEATVDEGGYLAFAYYRARTGVPRFERIRRITGYLVGTLDRFNDAKRAEERDRVKHGAEGVAR